MDTIRFHKSDIMKRKKLVQLTALFAGIVLLTSAGNKYFEISKNLEIFANVYKHLNAYYVDDIEPKEIIETSIDAVLENLDPYSDYIPSEELEAFRFQNTGKYGGIGATIQTKGDFVAVVSPYENSPADRADLKTGDLFITVDGQNVEGWTSDKLVDILKGTPGTEVVVEMDRVGRRFTKTIGREVIQVPNVPYYGVLENNVGYIKLSGFTEGAGIEVRNAVKDLNSNNELSGIVLDLKGNGGGLLNEAIDVANVFIPKNELVVYTKGKAKNSNKDYKTFHNAEDLKTPIIVLTDGSTASASEIVAGTIQDLDRGLTMGRTSFGKGLVQSTRPVAYNSQLKLTTAKYYIPSGRSIQRINYNEKDAEGKPLPVPDSLKKSFTTRKGRVVKDGGGITPDIEVDTDQFSEVAFVLFSRNHLLDYSVQYYRAHDKIASEEEFEITDAEYQDFVEFMSTREYEYVTATEKKLTELRKSISDDRMTNLSTDIDDMEAKVKLSKSQDLIKHKEEIKFLIEREIANRYYYRSGRIANGIDNDDDVTEALKVLSSPGKYDSLLSHR